jgi:hypothetical protein
VSVFHGEREGSDLTDPVAEAARWFARSGLLEAADAHDMLTW